MRNPGQFPYAGVYNEPVGGRDLRKALDDIRAGLTPEMVMLLEALTKRVENLEAALLPFAMQAWRMASLRANADALGRSDVPVGGLYLSIGDGECEHIPFENTLFQAVDIVGRAAVFEAVKARYEEQLAGAKAIEEREAVGAVSH